MGPPLGHIRDPYKQSRFVEAELTALLQAAGGTLPVIKKDARGVFVMETTTHAPAAAKATPAATPTAQGATPATAPAAKAPAAPAAPASKPPSKAGTAPDRTLNKRYTYAGVTDTGPVAGETFEQKVARLKAVSAAAKQRAEEGGGEVAPSATPDAPIVSTVLETAMAPPPTEGAQPATPPAASAPATTHKPTGQADRSLMIRSTYCGVVDTGPVPGETFEQKVARLAAVSAAAKQRSEGG